MQNTLRPDLCKSVFHTRFSAMIAENVLTIYAFYHCFFLLIMRATQLSRQAVALWRSSTRVFASQLMRVGTARYTHPIDASLYRMMRPVHTILAPVRFYSSTVSTTVQLDTVQNPPQDINVISFYRFVPIAQEDLEPVRQRLIKELSEIGVLGRIYVAREGINAQITCPEENVPALRHICDNFKELQGVTFNLSTEHRQAFRRLAVRIKQRIVSDGLPPDTYDLTREPTYLDPETWHYELSSFVDKEPGKRPILLDTRNHYETEIGYFKGAELPDVDTFREFIQVMEKRLEHVPKNEPIYMYCTGGIRCSKAGAILRSKGWEDVRMLKGGITAYGNFVRKHPELKSLFIGKNFTFDKRLGETITEDIIGRCHQCGSPCDRYTNCRNRRCNLLFIQCDNCRATYSHTCGSPICMEVEKAEREAAAQLEKQPCMHNHHERVRPREIMRRWPVVLHGYPDRIRPRLVLERVRAQSEMAKVDEKTV
jgi:UPF0176 protein